jgi:hypothetical protein
MNLPGFFADALLILHFFYFLFCVLGEAAVLFGAAAVRLRPAAAARLGWIRGRGFRLAHLVAVGIVGVEGIAGMLCPLTSWEYMLRRTAGQTVESEIPLVPRIVRSVLFYDFPFWVFTLMYVGFAALVVLTFILLPPRKKPGPSGPGL